ncbi:MAG: ABC transporter ATP-binding protein, partial [Myxococcota bacterium]|nr:ABC transporter ATP-binding protein [Myxococcota bacterium]
LARIWPFARPDGWAMVVALLLTPVVAALNLAQPWLLKEAIDRHIVPAEVEGLREVGLLYLAAVVGGYASVAVYSMLLAWSGQRTILRLRSALYAHTLGLAQGFFDQQPAGKLLTRITSDVESLGESITAGTVTIVLDVMMILGILGAMFWLDWRLSLALLALGPALLALLELLRRRLKVLFLQVREALASVNAFLAERVDGVRVVQLMGDEERTARRFDDRNQRFRDATKTANWYDAGMFALVDGTSRIFTAVMLWLGAGVAAAQLQDMGIDIPFEPVSAGLMVAFIDYLDRLFRPLRELSGKVTIIQRAIAALSKIFWLFEAAAAAGDEGDAVPDAVRGHIVLKDVRFRYRPDAEEVLKGIDLEVRPGESIAVVGASGSGKTTLTRLLDCSYRGYTGSITLDGQELSALRLSDLRAAVAAVRQDIQVFSESVRFNIDLDNPSIDAAQREGAATLVHADRFVDRLGWGHTLRERGADLSVGEGQLLTFARTMAHNPSVIILDEATASVDSITEGDVQDAIQRILDRKTVIVIAHRLSTVQSADRIIVMGAGKILEQGTHAQLMTANGAYASLVAAGQGVVGGDAEPHPRR